MDDKINDSKLKSHRAILKSPIRNTQAFFLSLRASVLHSSPPRWALLSERIWNVARARHLLHNAHDPLPVGLRVASACSLCPCYLSVLQTLSLVFNSLAVLGLLCCVRAPSSRGERASHCGGPSSCGAWTPARGLQQLQHTLSRLMACGIVPN